MQPTVNKIQDIAGSNYAASAAEAANLRQWQENQNQKAMNFNAAEAAKNRDWQKMMSDTAHQREIQDLKAAGLNPILSALNGNGASVGSGATASGVTSSGAMGSPDTTQSGALVSLLGSVLNAQMQMNAMNTSAMTNLAIADKNNAMSELVARIHAAGSAGAARIAADAAMERQIQQQEWDSKNPSNVVRAASSVGNTVSKFVTKHSEPIMDILADGIIKADRYLNGYTAPDPGNLPKFDKSAYWYQH